MKLKPIILFLGLLLVAKSYSQTSNTSNQQIGISLKASSNGFGGDIYYRPTKKLSVKAGAEYLSFTLKSQTLERYIGESVNIVVPIPEGNSLSFNSEGKVKTGSISLSAGYQPFKMFYVTAGIGKYLFKSYVTGLPTTDLTFPRRDIPDIGTVTPRILKENLGNFSISINPSNTFIPYMGIGLGSFVPQNKKYSLALEIGAYYVGNYVLKGNFPDGFDIENIDYGNTSITQEQKDQFEDVLNNEINKVVKDINREVNTIIDDINKKLESYKFYPVLKLTVGFRAFEF